MPVRLGCCECCACLALGLLSYTLHLPSSTSSSPPPTAGVAFLAIALLQFQPTAVVLQLVAGVLPAWLASEPTTAGPAAAAWA